MPKMKNRPGKLQNQATQATVHQPQGKVSILRPPTLIPLVIPINPHEVATPERGIAPPRTRQSMMPLISRRKKAAQGKRMKYIYPPLQPPAEQMKPRQSPHGAQLIRPSGRKPHTLATKKTPPASDTQMVLNKMTMKNKIPINLYNIITPADSHAPVAAPRKSEPPVLLPDMHDFNRRDKAKPLDKLSRFCRRTIITNDDFHRQYRLVYNTLQAQIKSIRPIVSRDNQRSIRKSIFVYIHNLM
jgi:hypothetical protein